MGQCLLRDPALFRRQFDGLGKPLCRRFVIAADTCSLRFDQGDSVLEVLGTMLGQFTQRRKVGLRVG